MRSNEDPMQPKKKKKKECQAEAPKNDRACYRIIFKERKNRDSHTDVK